MPVRHDLRRGTRTGADVRVIVEVQARRPDAKDLDRLRALGLEVQVVVGNKVIGAIPERKLPRLEKDDSVRAVERSEKLRLHRE